MLEVTPQTVSERRRPAWGLIGLAAGALVLVVAALVTLAVAERRQPVLAPASTPEGVVERFFDATYRGDYAAAYAMLDAPTRQHRTLAAFQARAQSLREAEVRVDAVAIHGQTATVTVTVTHFTPGGLFDSGAWSDRYDVLLERDGDTWRIVGEPFW